MKVPSWLDRALAQSESLSLDNAADRERLAAVVLKSIPSDALVIALGAAAATVLKQHGISDGAQILATKIARLAAKNIAIVLETA